MSNPTANNAVGARHLLWRIPLRTRLQGCVESRTSNSVHCQFFLQKCKFGVVSCRYLPPKCSTQYLSIFDQQCADPWSWRTALRYTAPCLFNSRCHMIFFRARNEGSVHVHIVQFQRLGKYPRPFICYSDIKSCFLNSSQCRS